MIRQRLYDLPELDRDRFDSITESFDQAWLRASQHGPEIEEFLPGDEPLRTLVLVAAIKTDLESQLARNCPASVESYVDRFAELREDLESQAELVLWEMELTGRTGAVEEYVDRFSHLKEQLRPMLAASGVARTWSAPPGFTKLTEIGRGSMGVVYRAWDETLTREVAIKFLYPSLLTNAKTRERFRNEAGIVASLSHPHVVDIYEFGEHEDQPYCVFEFCSGGNLAQRLNAAPMESRVAAQLLIKLAAGVQAAHQANVIHRDLKPSNVLFSADGRPKVADFGLALRLENDRLTRSGDKVGTISYAAPEQLSSSQAPTVVTDIYGLGAVLYHCLTDRPPFGAATIAQTYFQVVNSDPVPPSRINPVARDLETICLKCLAKNPSHRYGSVAELEGDLRRFVGNRPVLASRPGWIKKSFAWSRRNRWLATSIAFSVVALVGVIVLSAAFGIQQRRAVERVRNAIVEMRQADVLSQWDRANELAKDRKIEQALLLLADDLHQLPTESDDVWENRARSNSLDESIRMAISGWLSQCHTVAQTWPHPDKVTAIDVSPDGALAITACADGVIRIWEMASGRLRRQIEGRDLEITVLAFLPQRHEVVMGGVSGQLRFGSITAPHGEITVTGHSATVHAVAFSADGKYMLTGSADSTAKLWNVAERSEVACLESDGPVYTVGFSGDSQHFFMGGVAVGTPSGSLRQYSMPMDVKEEVGEPDWSISFDLPVRSANVSPDGATLVVGCDNWETSFWDMPSRKRFATTSDGSGKVVSTTFTSDGTTAAAGILDSNLAVLWDVPYLREKARATQEMGLILTASPLGDTLGNALQHPQPVTHVVFDPSNSEQLLTVCLDGKVRLWHRAPGPELTILPHSPRVSGRDYPQREYAVSAVDTDPSGSLVATGGWDGRVRLWSVHDGNSVGQPLVHDSPVTSVAFTPSGKSLLSGQKNGSICVWNLKALALVDTIHHPTGSVSGMSVNKEGILIAGGNGQAQCWRVLAEGVNEKLELLGAPLQHCGPEYSLAAFVSDRSKWMLTCSENGTAKLWNSDGSLVAILPHDNEVRGGSFSRDERLVITVSDDRTVRTWSAPDGMLQGTLTHDDRVSGATFVGDSNRVLTAGADGVQLWDTDFSRRIGPPYRFRDEAMDVVCRDDETVIFADWRGYGVVLRLPQAIRGTPAEVIDVIERRTGMTTDGGGGFRAWTSDHN
ncbi:MAG: serine/threonine protein kinase [Planctomycetales bacterium]|nr:serine/threonine protein kinase [Planctomycetales bacterium]